MLRRENGSEGKVSVDWKLRSEFDAERLLKSGLHAGTVRFRDGEKTASLWLQLASGWRDLDEKLEICVDLIQGNQGACLVKDTSKQSCVVTLIPGEKNLAENCFSFLEVIV